MGQQHVRKPADIAKASKMGRRETRAIRKKLYCLKPNIQEMKRSIRRKDARNRCRSCVDNYGWPTQPPGRGAISNEDIQGYEWDS
jgi:hypothetical protein